MIPAYPDIVWYSFIQPEPITCCEDLYVSLNAMLYVCQLKKPSATMYGKGLHPQAYAQYRHM
jgi:hypothetical protein